jgi:integrase
MSDDELSAFFLSLGQEPNHTVRDYLWISILTGARRSNVESMRWAEISWSTATWTIPAEKSKSGEAMTLPLIPKAVEILRARRESSTEESSAISPAPVKLGRKVENASQWVFPGVGATGHLVEPKTAWKRILSRASDLQLKEWLDANPRKTAADFVKHNPSAGAIRDVRLHDLRRTLGSKMAALGVSLPIIGKALGHRSLSATQIYSRVNLDAVRQGVTIATDAMLKLSGGVPLLGDGN